MRPLAGVLAACLCPLMSHGANWSFDPRVEVGGQYDDNYRLLPPGYHQSVSGAFGDARVDIHTVDPVNELRFSPGVRSAWFPNSSDDDSTDPYAEFYTAHHGVRSTAVLAASYIKESVVRSDRAASGTGGGLGNPDSGDSGFVALRNRLQYISVLPSFVRELTARDSLSANFIYSNARYEKFIPNTNVGYSHVGADLAFNHALTERHSFLVHALFSRNDPDTPAGAAAVNGVTNSYGLMGEWKYLLTDVAQAYVRAGGQRSQFAAVGANPAKSDTTYIAGAGVTWNYQVTQLFLDLTRTVDPSSTGYSIERDQVRFQISRSLTPLLLGFVSARAFTDKAADHRVTFRDRSYAVGSIGIEKRFYREWSVRGQFNYTYQDYANDGLGAAKSNMFELSLAYEPRRETASVGRYRR